MNIRVDLTTPIREGMEVVFRSPVDCSQVTGLKVYYLGESKEFVFADAHGNNVGDIDHLFAENVVVKVILDVAHGMAFVQNADTNSYLEGRFAELPITIAEKLCPKVSESSPCVQMQPIVDSNVKASVKKDSEYSHIKLYCTGKNLYPNNFSSLDERQKFFVEGYIHKGNGKLTETGTSLASGYIPVSHLVGKTLAIAGAYVGGSNPGFAFYDAYKTFLGTQYSGNTATALVPKDAAYFRFTIKYDNIRDESNKVDYGRIQLEIGNAVTEVEPYREISIDPASGDIELDRVFLDGVNTFYAYAGNMEGGVFVPYKAVEVHVEGYNHPAHEIEKQRKEIEQLKGIVLSLGASMTV